MLRTIITIKHEIHIIQNPFGLNEGGLYLSRNIPPDVLSAAGQPNSVAQVVATLSSNPSLSIKQLSRKSGLPQSQVASGLKQCRYRGWVISTQGESKGKGRPRHLWELGVSPLEIIRELEVEARAKHTILANAVKRLHKELNS